MKYERVKFFLMSGWIVFLATGALFIWLMQSQFRLYLSARSMDINHRITRRDLIPRPATDTPPVGRYVCGSAIAKWSTISPDDMAKLPTVDIPDGQVPLSLDLPPPMVDSINRGSRLDVWDRISHDRQLNNVSVLAVTCDAKSCTAIVAADKSTALKIQAANIQLFIRSY